MAEHIYLSANEDIFPSTKFLASADHVESAKIGHWLLESLHEQIEVRDIQIPKNRLYTCWYVSIIDFPKKPIINLTLQKNGVLNVEYRYMQFVSPELRENMQWQTNNWVYARISKNGFTKGRVLEITRDYVPKCVEAVNDGRLRRGGTSAAEDAIDDMFPYISNDKAIQGSWPEWLRNESGNLLQLDFLFNGNNIAIEVQGPHHKKDLYGKPIQLAKRQENDAFKVKACLEHGISLIWMESEGIQRELVRLPLSDQKRELKQVFDFAKANHPCHIVWTNPGKFYNDSSSK